MGSDQNSTPIAFYHFKMRVSYLTVGARSVYSIGVNLVIFCNIFVAEFYRCRPYGADLSSIRVSTEMSCPTGLKRFLKNRSFRVKSGAVANRTISVNLGVFCSFLEFAKGCIFSSAFLKRVSIFKGLFYSFQGIDEVCR